MIPLAHIQQWSAHAPWPDPRQVEQDLIISRALCDLFGSERLRDRIAFRGGTAIHKLLFGKPLRYSEDIDLVQTQAEPIKGTVAEIRRVLSWLGTSDYVAAAHSVRLTFRFRPEQEGGGPLKLKIEINTREHRSLTIRRPTHSPSTATGIRRPSRSSRSSRRNCSARNSGPFCSETRIAICSISTRACSDSGSTATKSSHVSSTTLRWKDMRSAAPTPKSGCSRSSIGA